MKKKLTKQEIEILEQRLESLRQAKNESSTLIRESDHKAVSYGTGGFDDIPSFDIYEDYHRLKEEIKEIEDTLNNSEVVDVISTDKIDIGSSFVATLNDLDGAVVTNRYTLFAGSFLALSQNTDFVLVSVNSPFGKAVIDKRVKDEFSYVTPGKIVISGVIDEILNVEEKEEAKQLIKNNNKNTRN